ncbi:carbohydrate ABC transporter permease [Paenibacillus sp. WQ 127069]|uniref:Carbohydrate ABC transporter permease n=1 Tax=Paenibacillus baimaensis TaxID=2982185 RepID=A0ABT2US74_9BACL|nr:carbohydrate ABC transporter permease [Paenibacillus sp. WQ 127069]MCU6797492.1 carbohydrate ABC transporter permease [Paenibacillus sp. WQ 127069]
MQIEKSLNPAVTQQSLLIRRKLADVCQWLFLLITALLLLFPVAITLLDSFKTNAEITGGGTLLPTTWHFANYVEAWQKGNFSTFSVNSLFLGLTVTIGTLIIASTAAYAVDRREFLLKKVYIAIQASTLFISIGAVVLRPQFDLMVQLHLQKSLWGVIIILISAHASIFFILIGFFKGIPRELDESALIDGCNFYSIYWRIILPLLRPGLGVAALFTFKAAWNEYILPFVFTLSSPKLQPLTVGLANLRYGSGGAAQNHLIMAGACLSILPILIVYIFANKSFMQVTAGSVKG